MNGRWRLSTRTQAPRPPPGQDRGMLWSDPKDEPPQDMRDAQAMLRRLIVVLALAMLVVVYVLGVGF
ncbi:hypothetical protein SSAG_04846 [Streptomyces sp. Mg1]|nr:hypothetical protein SSAG_04846 [Streptomyces sp. Mg1]